MITLSLTETELFLWVLFDFSASFFSPSPVLRCTLVPGARAEPEEAETLFQTAASWARERVHAQRIHNATAEEGAFGPTQFIRPTSEDLVSKPTHEEEKTDVERAGSVFLLGKE